MAIHHDLMRGQEFMYSAVKSTIISENNPCFDPDNVHHVHYFFFFNRHWIVEMAASFFFFILVLMLDDHPLLFSVGILSYAYTSVKFRK